jgi:peptidoglycan L-alanyl-D-glutamate endopeptidase CwlK
MKYLIMASRNLTDLDSTLQPLAREFLAQCASANITAAIDCTWRSGEEQNDDYAKGVTKAKAGESPHNCVDATGNPAARAFDIYITNPDGTLNWNTASLPWEQAVQIGLGLGLISGSNFKDIIDFPHFELPNWRNGAIFNTISPT